MIDPSWHIDEPDTDETAPGPQTALVSLHFLRAALRRLWWIWVGLACVGMMLGAAWAVVVPAERSGTVSLLLAHDPATDPAQAMATDVTFLRTRTVANKVIDRLGLDMTPEAFQASIVVNPVTSDVMILETPASDDTAAVARARTLGDAYLEYRTRQIRRESNALINGYRSRVKKAQEQVRSLTEQYDALSETGPGFGNQIADILTERTQRNEDIDSYQQSIQDTALQTKSIVFASHVIDPASAVPQSAKKRFVLSVGSGLIGGMAVGIGLVLFMALTSNRLRRREEVALALGAPVRFSAGKLGHARPWSWARGSSPSRDLQILVHGLDSAISPLKGPPVRLALAAVDNPGTAELVVAALAAQLTRRGVPVFLVDLSESGRLDEALQRALNHDHQLQNHQAAPVVFRPEGVPSFARGPIGAPAALGVATDLPENDPRRPGWDAADVVLTLAEVDPAIGVDHLKSWADQLVLLVTAGRSSAERLRTTAQLVRSGGLQLLFAMLAGADRTDESLGLSDTADAAWPAVRRTS